MCSTSNIKHDDINNATAVVVTAPANVWIELMLCLWFNSYGAIVAQVQKKSR